METYATNSRSQTVGFAETDRAEGQSSLHGASMLAKSNTSEKAHSQGDMMQGNRTEREDPLANNDEFQHIKTIMPFGSITLGIPKGFQEDLKAHPDFVCYYEDNPNTGTLMVRRDDFAYDPGEDVMKGRDFAGIGPEDVGKTWFSGFERLRSTLRGDDISNVSIEPRTGNEQLICYVKHGIENDIEIAVYWWVRGKLQSDMFTVCSFNYALPTAATRTPLFATQFKVLDKEIRKAFIFDIKEAKSLHEETNFKFDADQTKRDNPNAPVGSKEFSETSADDDLDDLI